MADEASREAQPTDSSAGGGHAIAEERADAFGAIPRARAAGAEECPQVANTPFAQWQYPKGNTYG